MGPRRTTFEGMSAVKREAPGAPHDAGVVGPLKRVLVAPPVERTKLLVVVSAWWTLAQMERSGLSFDAFLSLASREPKRAEALWDQMTTRLFAIAAESLELFPEAVLTEEARHFIEAVVDTMGSSSPKSEPGK